MFHDMAPGVTFDLYMEAPNVIEEGVINGKFSVGIVPLHRRSPMLTYQDLYTEDMRLYCGQSHPLFDREQEIIPIEILRDFTYAGLSFNSPNMAVHQKLSLRKSAFVQSEEALALLVLSGRYLAFLPSHMAEPFVVNGQMRHLKIEEATYTSTLTAIARKSTATGRRLKTFWDCLGQVHS